jgi:aspartyl protease family protein
MAISVRFFKGFAKGSAMRQILILAAAVLMVGGFAARYLDRTAMQAPAHAAAVQSNTDANVRPAASSRSLTLESGDGGHYPVEVRIEGRRIDFIVDTGASLVILREWDAGQAGFRPMRSDYTATVSTANGKIKAAPFKLDRVEVGGITVYDVPALVLPDEALGKNLLGMSFLSRLRRYEVANGRMVLEQ